MKQTANLILNNKQTNTTQNEFIHLSMGGDKMKSNSKIARQFLAKMESNKKGQSFGLNSIPQVVLILVIIGIVLVVGLSIMQSVQDDQTVDSAAFNASDKAIEGVSTIADNLPLIALVVVLGIIITVLIVSLGAFVLGRP